MPSKPSPRKRPGKSFWTGKGGKKPTRAVPSQPGTTGSKRPRTMGHDSAPGGTRRPRSNRRRGGGATY